MTETDEPRHDRPPSAALVDSAPALPPPRTALQGRYARVEPVDPHAHATELYAAGHGDEAARAIWDFLPYGPFASAAAFEAWLHERAISTDPLFFAVRDARTGRPTGMASFLNIHPPHGTIEIGHIWFGPALQKTPAATESLFLLLRHAFDDLGYRRLEWKCNALNAGSRRAAVRLGFSFEGIFYQHMIVKGRNRDTAWFSILDGEWPRRRAGFERWLAPENFDADGRQRASLAALTRGPQ